MDVKADAFYPKPKISSSILYFKVNKIIPDNIKIKDLEILTNLVFSKRRKKISTIFKNLGIKNSSIDFNKRPENLTLSEFYELAYLLKESTINI